MSKKITLLTALIILLSASYVFAVSSNGYEEIFAPPVNDDCSGAISLTVNNNYLCANKTSGTLLDATASTAPSGCPGVSTKANDDVWFKFVATETIHRIDISNIAGSPTDLYFMVYDGGATGSCNALTAIFCSDPEVSTISGGITVGNTYFIRVYSNSSAPGATTTFDICVGSMAPPPSNDDCANAEAISSLPFNQTFDASAATNNSGSISGTGCIDMNDGIWFTVVGNGGTLRITAAPDNWDVAISVYTGSCGTFTCIEDSNIGGNSITEGVNFTSTVGTTYYVNIGHPGAIDQPEGIFNLAVTSTTLSVDDLVAKGFTYYPNPVKDVLTMNAKENIEQIIIYTGLGREIKRIKQSDKEAEINFYNLPTGVYFVKATIGSASGAFKVLKE
ncbi:MAG: hypothetical protein CSA39_06560 [Flavobacteriales bacterium]|nr:MAG: hypothetical protein CSA39_06560 [Flavobacteriales bacterium]